MERKSNGFFLVIDGIDGSGKTTHAELIADELKREGYKVYLTKEPTDGKIGGLLREYLKDPESLPIVDALLFSADRVEHCYNEIIPKLNDGYLVISARYIDSSYVYQTTKISPNEENKSDFEYVPDIEWLKLVNRYSILPDLTIILDLPPNIAYYRRFDLNRKYDTELDKFEKIEFLETIRNKFLSIAKGNPVDPKSDRINRKENLHVMVHLNGDESIDDVHSILMKIIYDLNILEYVKKEDDEK